MRWLIEWVSHKRFEDLPNLARSLARSLYFLFPSRRKIMLENISLAFPDFGAKRVETLARNSLSYMLLAVLDTVWWYGWHRREKERSRDWFLNEGVKFYQTGGRDLVLRGGGLVCTGHYGTFTALVQYFAFHRPTGVFLKKIKNPYLQGWADRIIREMGVVPLYIDEVGSVKTAMKILRGDGILLALLDQHFGRKGRVLVEFFGRPAYAGAGAVELAMRMGKPVVAIFCQRESDCFGAIDKGVLWNGKLDKSPREIVQDFTNSLESVIMSQPEQWAWLHRRWKV